MKRTLLLFYFVQSLMLYGQNNLSLYPYRMDPRQHPDYHRYLVKSPDMTVFNNKIQFMALRDLSGDFKQKLDLWVSKDKLGDILWVSYPLIFQDNLQDVVAEIKKRNLYLFDLWGYVPGSGPGGYWRQFVIPDGVLSLFESQLGNHWLGMDNGEQDGRYVGSFAPRMYPMGDTHRQQYFNFQRHFQTMGELLGNKLATLVSLNFGHYFLKEGIYTLIGAETAQGLPNSQIYYSFIRGAGKQYGVNWFGNASVWNRWGYKTYGSDATNIDDDYGSGGPLKGTSLSLLKRLIYNHIFYNCVAVGFEGSMRLDNDKLSPIGKIQQSAVQWVEKNGEPGSMYTPVALMTDFFSGWSFPRHLYSHQAYKVWGNLPYQKGDYMTDAIFNLLYPHYQDASYYKDERGFITATPYGDIADAVMSDCPLWVLQQYPVLVIAGELRRNLEINDKLEQYVKNGGHLVMTAATLRNMPNGIVGITAKDSLHTLTAVDPITHKINKTITEKQPYTLYELNITSTTNIIQWSSSGTPLNIKHPVVVEQTEGKGKVTIFASPYGIADTPQCTLPVKVAEEEPLLQPFPVLAHVQQVLDEIFSSLKIFETNADLSTITCIKNNNEYTVLIANDDWMSQQFTLTSKVGKIVSIKELPTDYSEMKATGFTPKVVNPKGIGSNSKTTIAGGNTRIFQIKLDNPKVTLLPEIKSKPNPQHRYLTLRNTFNIKEEILSRPTFFQHYDGVVIDWRYINQREQNVLAEEAKWLSRQKVNIMVDLTSGINLFPDLRIVNNDSALYVQSIKTIEHVINKTATLGGKTVILSTQRTIENNFTKEQFTQSVLQTYQSLSDYAAQKNIHLLLRHSFARTPDNLNDLQTLAAQVNRPNFTVLPALSSLLMNENDLEKNSNNLENNNTQYLLLSAIEKDIHQQLWNTNAPLYSSSQKERIKKVISQFKNVNLIFDVLYSSQDEEYLDSKMVNNE